MHRSLNKMFSVFVVLALVMMALPMQSALAAAGSLTGTYSQNFNTLASSGTPAWTNDLTISGWYSSRSTYLAGTGSINTGSLYSFGTTAADRALGSVASGGTNTIFYGVRLVNDTGGVVTQLNVGYTGEQWRSAGSSTTTPSVAQTLDFQYQVGATAITGGTWIDVNALDFTSPVYGTVTASQLDGNNAANRIALSASITNLTIQPGQEVWLRWQDINDANNDHALAVDDLSVDAVSNPVDAAPAVTSTVPANNATNVNTTTNITVNFSELVNVDTSQVTLECPLGAPLNFNVIGSSATINSLALDPVGGLPFNTLCKLTIPAGAVSDVDGNDPPDTLVATFYTGFTTEVNPCTQPVTLISAVQGNGLTSPFAGQSVTVQGVVTASFPGLSGFYMQEEPSDVDANPTTSEGIFVFTGAAPTVIVGNQVRVTATVSEFGSNGTVTELTSPSITDCGAGQTITPTEILFPVSSASDFESFEGMLVRFPQELFIAEYFNYDRFGEIVLGLPLDGYDRFYNPTSIVDPGAPAQALLNDYDLRSITLDDGSSAGSPSSLPHPNGLPFSATNRFRGGDTLTGQVGVIDHSFGIYRMHPVQAGVYAEQNPRPASPTSVGGTIKVASYNVLNYFLTIDTTSSSSSGPCGPFQNQDCRGADSASEFARQRSKLIQALTAIDADVYGLIELENTTGVDTPGDIVNGLNAATAPGTFASINTGTIGGDAIRVGIVYKPGKVTPVGAFQTIDENDDPRFDTSRNRPSLAQTFEVNATGARFTLVVNHLKSKGSACTGDPDTGDGQGNCNLTRVAAAQALVDWLASDPTGSGDPDFLVIGDMNSYAKEDPITTIKAGSDDQANTSDDFVNLVESRLGPLAYSYVFDGQAGYLDHALASSSLDSQVTGVTDWHLNADEPDIFDYNDTIKDTGETTAERKGFDVTDVTSPFRTSDHDPVIVGLNFVAPTVDAGGPYNVVEGSSGILSATGTAWDGSTPTFAWDLDNNGSFETSGQSVTFSAASIIAPATFTVKVKATDAFGNSAVDEATVNVIYNFSGFFQPVDNAPTVNTVKAGQAVPVKFSLTGDHGLNIFAPGYPKVQFSVCSSSSTDAIEVTTTAGTSSLTYDPTTDQYTYVWKTDKGWAGNCGTLQILFNDGVMYTALFRFTK